MASKDCARAARRRFSDKIEPLGSFMSWIVLLLGLLLALAGGAGLVASIDLQTTELGLVYAACGAIGVSGGIITIAIGLLIRRVDALRGALLEAREPREEEAPRAME